MRRLLMVSALMLTVVGCGSDGSEDLGSGANSVDSTVSQTGGFGGTWVIDTKKSNDNCGLLEDTDIEQINGKVFVGQNGLNVVVHDDDTDCSRPYIGQSTGDSFIVSRPFDVTDC